MNNLDGLIKLIMDKNPTLKNLDIYVNEEEEEVSIVKYGTLDWGNRYIGIYFEKKDRIFNTISNIKYEIAKLNSNIITLITSQIEKDILTGKL